jgi:translation initiation factor 1 (eIF-1/SUI1)
MATTKNTALTEDFDTPVYTEVGGEQLSPERILRTESDILQGLLNLGNDRNEEENYRPVQIRRKGILQLEFRIRPITEEENQTCWRKATRYAPTKAGQPKVAIETNQARYRSYLIYTSTVNEDRAKIWDNKKAQEELGVVEAVALIDKVLLAGEKGKIIDLIDEISGFEDDAEELARDL